MTNRIQKITADLSAVSCVFRRDTHADRIETGLLQINDDSCGVFIRSNHAEWVAGMLSEILQRHRQQANGKYLDHVMENTLETHIKLLTSCTDRVNVDI
jgi:hypothetical protein